MSYIAAALIVGGTTLVGSAFVAKGAKKQGQAIDRATESSTAVQGRIQDFSERVYEESASFRELAEEEAKFDFAQKQAQGKLREELLPDIYKGITEDPFDDPAFKRALSKGTESVRSLYEPLGLDAGSGPTSVATGEFAGSLVADTFSRSKDRRLNTLLSLYGGQLPASGAGQFGAQGTAAATSLYGPISNISGNVANLTTAGGAVQGNLYGSIGRDISNLGQAYALYGGGGGGGTPRTPR